MADDKKDPTTKKGGELKGKDSTKADQGSGGSNDNTGFAQVMQLLATMMANQGNSRRSSTDPVIDATQRANAALSIGRKDPAKTRAIDARRRKMNVSTQRGRTKEQKARDEESRSKTKRRNKDKKFARADRDLDRLDAQLKQDRIDIENLIAENKAAEARAAADAQIEKNNARIAAREEEPPILPTPVGDSGNGSPIIEGAPPLPAPEPAAPATTPSPEQQELGPNPLLATVYANYPSERPNPGPFSTDQRGGGPYSTPESIKYAQDQEYMRSLEERRRFEAQDVAAANAAAQAGPPSMPLPNVGTGMTLADYDVQQAQGYANQGPFNTGLNPVGYVHYGQGGVAPPLHTVEPGPPPPPMQFNPYPNSGYGVQDMPYGIPENPLTVMNPRAGERQHSNMPQGRTLDALGMRDQPAPLQQQFQEDLRSYGAGNPIPNDQPYNPLRYMFPRVVPIPVEGQPGMMQQGRYQVPLRPY